MDPMPSFQVPVSSPPSLEDFNASIIDSLDASTTRFLSAVQDVGIDMEQSALESQKMGSVLIQQLDRMAEAARVLQKVLTMAVSENTALVTTSLTLASGLNALYQGNIPWGLAITLAGAHEAKKIYDKYFANNPLATNDLLTEIKSGILLIQQLEESQKENLQALNQQIKGAQIQVEGIDKEFQEIYGLATEGIAEGERKKQEALGLCKEAKALYQEAHDELARGHQVMLGIMNDFEDMLEDLQELQKNAQTKTMDVYNADNFIDQTESIVKKMTQTLALLEKNQRITSHGLELHQEATQMNTEAEKKHLEAVMGMNYHLQRIQDKAENEQKVKELQSQLKSAEEQVQKGIEIADHAQEVTDHVLERHEELEKQLENNFGYATMLVGAGAVATMSGPFAIPVGFLTGGLFHYARRLNSAANEHIHAIIPPQESGNFVVTYNPVSTGWGNYLIGAFSKAIGGEGRSSKTAGVVTLNIGGEVLHCNFNKGRTNNQGKMDEADMLKLKNLLENHLSNQSITPNECLGILDALTFVNTDHGYVNLVNLKCVYFKDIRSQCLSQK